MLQNFKKIYLYYIIHLFIVNIVTKYLKNCVYLFSIYIYMYTHHTSIFKKYQSHKSKIIYLFFSFEK